MTRLVIIASVVFAVGCGGSYPANQSTTTATRSKARGSQSGGLDVTAMALPYRVLRADGGQEIDEAQFLTELADAAGVCLGETHPNPHHHWAQLHVFTTLVARRDGKNMALGMEMFQRPFQGVLDDYVSGRIDEAAMLARTDWGKRWGYDFAMYRPLVALAAERGLPILALNISAELKTALKRKGIDGLTAKERARVPELDLDDVDHKAWFDDLMADLGGAHGHDSGDSNKKDKDHEKGDDHGEDEDPHAAARDAIYMSQVLWDETMADTAARWLAEGTGRQVVIIAGSGHCHETAIAKRMRRRGATRVVSIRPVMDDNVARELAKPTTDYLFVMAAPAE